jgi:hypothetical protein
MNWRIGLLVLIMTLFGRGATVAAHGGGDLIARSVQAGPYKASIWVNPPDPRAEETIHFTVGLAAPEDESPVLDAAIQVIMRETGSSEVAAEAPATTDQSVNKLFYETDIEVEGEGVYQVEFQVAGPEGKGSIFLDVEVKPSSRVNWFLIGIAGLGFILIVGWWRSRHSQNSGPVEQMR